MNDKTNIATNTKIDWTQLTTGDKMKITFDGKTFDVTYVRPGVVQKTASIFYIQDVVTHEWLYCFPERLTNMITKGVDLANYKGRGTKAIERKAIKETKAAAAKERQEKQLQAAKDAAAKIANATKAPEKAPEAPKNEQTAGQPAGEEKKDDEPAKPVEQAAAPAPKAPEQASVKKAAAKK